ncbi:AraC family transcriptional regulator [Lentibacter algarum]|uniref:AraC family transcriptional regulator n=1 Tax=Lentibacter algarum TaxID=576131 RepID=UPI001C073627|nr:AraC family transcriptional regulator [Lentibacter algarum]MBU2981783.1 AraC family transcriptional regulator [Lentibacter algarum]
MKHPETYPISAPLAHFSALTGIPASRILRRANLPDDFLDHHKAEVNALTYFDIWHAYAAEASESDDIFALAKEVAAQLVLPSILAYSASATLRQGVKRMSLFKPLICPLRLDISEPNDVFTFTIAPLNPSYIIPPLMVKFELAFLLALFEASTDSPVAPLLIGLPNGVQLTPAEQDLCKVVPTPAKSLTITLSGNDAARPLLSANAALIKQLEPLLHQQLSNKKRALGLQHRLHNALLEMLPAGESNLASAAHKLNTSRRSLQRQLKAEGVSFQHVLESTRAELASSYLKRPDISVTEIAYLLAFRDPNSFYRAFQGWTGLTPMQARAAL